MDEDDAAQEAHVIVVGHCPRADAHPAVRGPQVVVDPGHRDSLAPTGGVGTGSGGPSPGASPNLGGQDRRRAEALAREAGRVVQIAVREPGPDSQRGPCDGVPACPLQAGEETAAPLAALCVHALTMRGSA